MPAAARKKKISPLLKLVLEMGPLGLFFLAINRPDFFKPALDPFFPPGIVASTSSQVYPGSPVFMITAVVALVAGWLLTRHIPIMPLVSGIFVLIFGGLTLWFDNPTFNQIKPTIVDTLFGVILLGGLWRGRSLLRYVLDVAFELTDAGWWTLTLRWGLFFLFLAALNEVVRNFFNDSWAAFKFWGTMPITLVFTAFQVPLMLRSEVKHREGEVEPETGPDSIFD
jgi:intracellular septation protein